MKCVDFTGGNVGVLGSRRVVRWAAWRVGLVLWMWLGTVCAVSAATATKPNVVFILADDLGYGDLGCYGQERIRTPRLDRMAREGTRFTQVYSGATVCAPSRCVLMTGKHTGHARVRGNAGQGNPLAQSLRYGDVTVARVLSESGYRTGLVGKWGLGGCGRCGTGIAGEARVRAHVRLPQPDARA